MTDSTFYLLLHSADYLLELLAAVWFFMTRKQRPDRSRLFLSLFFASSLLGSVTLIMQMFHVPLDGRLLVMSPVPIFISFPIFIMLFLYVSECVHPYYVTWKRFGLLLSPWFLLGLLFLMVAPDGGTILFEWRDIFKNLDKADVWIRLAMLLLYLLYGIWAAFIPRYGRANPSTRPFIRVICVVAMMMTITFIGGHGLRLWLMDGLHQALYVLINLLTLYSEFYERLKPLRFKGAKAAAEMTEQMAERPQEVCEQEDCMEPQGWDDRLMYQMNVAHVWLDPDLTLDKLCRAVGTNRTYLATAIKKQGYKGFSDIVNSYRIQHFMQLQAERPEADVMELFYEVGYRSRTTAVRNYTHITGHTINS